MRKMCEMRSVLILGMAVALLLACCHFAQAQDPKTWDVVLEWAPNVETDLNCYQLYENGVMVQQINAGTESVTRIVEAGAYSWYLTALDDSMNESGPSNSVGITLDDVPPSMEGVTITISISVHIQ